jgi:triphosphoribosyl-dephospho-CoA synthase
MDVRARTGRRHGQGGAAGLGLAIHGSVGGLSHGANGDDQGAHVHRLCRRGDATAKLAAWPKPGLVSHVDNGSHTDMDAAMLQASAESLRPFFRELAKAGQDGADMGRLRAIGLRAETAMLAVTGGVNTHRGAIFGLGLLCAGAGTIAEISIERAAFAPMRLGDVVRRRWAAEIGRGPIPLFSHGAEALRRYGAGGARAEAASGFRSVYEAGWPALRQGRSLKPNDHDAAPVQACFALIASVCDTNLLHRGGAEGVRYATEAAASFLSQGGVGAPDWRARAAAVHAAFVARRLSPGGCADLLAMTLFVDALETGVALR